MRRAYKIALVSFVASLPLLMAPTGGIPSRPRFQTVTATALSGYLSSATRPVYKLTETDAAANNRVWYLEADAEQFRCRVVDDAESVGVSWCTVDRTANVVDTINFTATAVQANGESVATVISARKASATTRTSTTTSAADPDLTFTLPAGSWELTGFLLFDAITTTTQGARYQLNFAGTFDPALVVRCVDTRTSLLAAATVGIQAMNSDTTIADVSTANLDIAEIRCTMRATVGGTLQIRWAQEASSANGTRLNNGSWLTAKRVGA